MGLMSGTSEARQPPPINSIQIAIDTSQKGQITAVGSYTKATGVTLKKVEVWAFPSGCGVMPPQNDQAAIKNNSWGPVTITTRVYKGQYAVRADGFFSDQTIHSSTYVIQQVDGNDAPVENLKLVWAAGYPKSAESKKIMCYGQYTGNPHAQLTGEIVVTPVNGGLRTLGVLKMNATLSTWRSDPPVTVPTGGPYSVVAFAPDVGPNQKWYCAPYAVTQVVP
jgi:hypothetical protein